MTISLTDFEQADVQALLETHPTKAYAAARALYLKRGDSYRGPFGAYTASPGLVCKELVLSA